MIYAIMPAGKLSVLACLFMLIFLMSGLYGDVPAAVNFQGRLTDSSNNSVPDGNYQMTFSIYADSIGGSPLWSSGSVTVEVSDGLFTYRLGSQEALPDDLFSGGADRWLGITIAEDPEITPRARLTSSAYSYQALRADTAGYALDGPWGTGSGWSDDGTTVRLTTAEDSVGIGTTFPQAKFHVEGDAMIVGKATIGVGHSSSGYMAFLAGEGHSASGNYVALPGGSGNQAEGDYSSISGGRDNIASGDYSSVGGGIYDSAMGVFSSVAGGTSNLSDGNYSTVSGGGYNHALGEASAIGGGSQNSSAGDYSTIAGGGPSDPGNPTSTNNSIYDNYGTIGGGGGNQVGSDNGLTDDDEYCTIGGGMNNVVSEIYSIVGGGLNNSAGGYAAAICGGSGNSATGNYSHVSAGSGNAADGTGATIGGGATNTASGNYTLISGGQNNTVIGQYSIINGGAANNASANFSNINGGSSNNTGADYAVISGGKANTASGLYSNVGGGENDTASADWSTISGGYTNKASSSYSTISGGNMNSAQGMASNVGGGENNSSMADWSSIGGGQDNSANGQYATIPGGSNNQASGSYSLAAGRNASALHDGTFVWADSNSSVFASTAENQYLISADGGVGIGTNSPSEALEVSGTIYSNDGGFKFPDGSIQNKAVRRTVVEENYMGSSSIPVEIDTTETVILSEIIQGDGPGIIVATASGNITIDHQSGRENWNIFAINTQPNNIWFEGGAIRTIKLPSNLPTGPYVLNFALTQSFYTAGGRELYLVGLNRSESATYDTAYVSMASLTLIYIPIASEKEDNSIAGVNDKTEFDISTSGSTPGNISSASDNYKALEQRVARLEAELGELK
jgi:hypothetical protein